MRAVLLGHRRAARAGRLGLLGAAGLLSRLLVAHGPAARGEKLQAIIKPEKSSRWGLLHYTHHALRPDEHYRLQTARGEYGPPLAVLLCPTPQVERRSTSSEPVVKTGENRSWPAAGGPFGCHCAHSTAGWTAEAAANRSADRPNCQASTRWCTLCLDEHLPDRPSADRMPKHAAVLACAPQNLDNRHERRVRAHQRRSCRRQRLSHEALAPRLTWQDDSHLLGRAMAMAALRDAQHATSMRACGQPGGQRRNRVKVRGLVSTTVMLELRRPFCTAAARLAAAAAGGLLHLLWALPAQGCYPLAATCPDGHTGMRTLDAVAKIGKVCLVLAPRVRPRRRHNGPPDRLSFGPLHVLL